MKRKTPAQPPYLDPSLSPDERVEDLLGRMTLEEKIHQLSSYAPWVSGRTNREIFLDKKGNLSESKTRRHIGTQGIGSLTCMLHNFTPREAARAAIALDKFVKKRTRLGIPIMIHDEALHGLTAIQSTAFPQSLGLAATWDPALMRRLAAVIGTECRTRGIRQVLAPTINITRDPRCGRTEETYGEDPYLSSRMAVAFVKGVQSQGVACTLKHFAANFVADGGRDSGEVHLSERALREVCFPAFEAAVREGGALSVMAAYNSLDGVPCSSNRWLLTDVLRKEWGFRGFAVADYLSVDQVHNCHCVAPSPAHAGKQCLEAGLDVELPHMVCYEKMIALARKGGVSSEAIDTGVRNVLRTKFVLGLFDEPAAHPAAAASLAQCPEHRSLALTAAQESIVLLKNEGGLLPLGRKVRSIAVIGPNANETRLGCYSCTGLKAVTPLQGIRRRVGKRTTVRFAAGCGVLDDDRKGFARAVRIASQSDLAVLVMGNCLESEGEGRDRCNLDLPGVQEELIRAVVETGTPVVVVLVTGGAVTMESWLDDVPTVLYAWYPGMEGGYAIADVLLGRCDPGGRLPLTLPRKVSQLPLYYNAKSSGRSIDYADLRGPQPLFSFGFGLSYTTFRYSNLRATPRNIGIGGRVTVRVDVRNTGKREGREVVQLYLTDCMAEFARPVKELKAFKRIRLKPGKKTTVEFVLGEKELRYLDRNFEYVVEPGTFEVMVGRSSEEGLKTRFEVFPEHGDTRRHVTGKRRKAAPPPNEPFTMA